MLNLPYSYHTFLFPFIWNDDGKTTMEDFQKKLAPEWKNVKWENIFGENVCTDDYKLEYAKYQYFTPAMRKLLFPKDNLAMMPYVYCDKNDKPIHENANYFIAKTIGSNGIMETTFYKLIINGIKLKIFNSGIAIMVFEMEYKGDKAIAIRTESEYKCKRPKIEDAGEYKCFPFSLDDINKINEYGRRICLPFIGEKDKPGIITADEIKICICGESTICSDFSEIVEKFHAGKNEFVLTHIMDSITQLLGDSFTSNKEKCGETFIYPAVDDRMFVCCLIVNQNLSDKLKGLDTIEQSFLNGWDKRLVTIGADDAKYITDIGCERKYASYKEGWGDETTFSNQVYKFMFIENDLTCQNTIMKKDLLEKSVYERWTNMGTLYGVTHHSLVCITNENVVDSVIYPFLTLYVDMAIVALAQRATILSLSAQAAEFANNLNTDNLNRIRDIEQIEELQKNYVKAQSQIMLFEVTTQEQGVEIFNMLKEQLYIKENKAELDDQMNNLRDVASITYDHIEHDTDKKLNEKLGIVAIIALILAAFQVIFPLFWDTECCLVLRLILTVIVVGVAVAGGLIYSGKINSPKKKK